MPANNVTVLLAHGAWADGSSWSKVISQLAARGIRAVAAPLPLTSLGDDVAALDRTLARIDGPVVLAGHAYAGGVIGSAHASNVQALVYIAALAPDEGETVGDVFHRGEPHPQAPLIAPDEHGLIWLPETAFATAFAQNAQPEELAVLAAVQRPIAVPCITEPVSRPLWKDRPSWFLIAEEDRMIAPSTQHITARRMNAHIRSHDVDHAPGVTAAGIVTDVIAEAVASVSNH